MKPIEWFLFVFMLVMLGIAIWFIYDLLKAPTMPDDYDKE